MVSNPTDFSTYFRTIIFLLGNLFILQHKWCQNFLTTVIFSYHNLYCTFVLTSVLYIYLYCSYLFTYVLYKRPTFPFHNLAPFLVLILYIFFILFSFSVTPPFRVPLRAFAFRRVFLNWRAMLYNKRPFAVHSNTKNYAVISSSLGGAFWHHNWGGFQLVYLAGLFLTHF